MREMWRIFRGVKPSADSADDCSSCNSGDCSSSDDGRTQRVLRESNVSTRVRFATMTPCEAFSGLSLQSQSQSPPQSPQPEVAGWSADHDIG
jgi:hypothetical protein